MKHVFRSAILLTATVLSTAVAMPAQAWHDRYYDRDWHPGYESGWERGHWRGSRFYRDDYYHVPEPGYASSRVVCTDEYNPLPMVLGSLGGAAVGTQIGSGSGRTAAIIGGALLGGMLGGQYGQPVQHCAQEVFYNTRVGTPARWVDRDVVYEVTPTRNFEDEGRYCREYQSTATVGGRRQSTYGTACMQPDGSWEVIN